MQQSEIDYLDGEFQVQENEPSTIEEVTALIGEQATVDEATSNLRYRNKYPRVYRKVSEAIAAGVKNDSGETIADPFPRAQTGTRTLKGGVVKPVLESENDHLRAFLKGRKVKDEHGNESLVAAPEGNRAVLAELFTKIAQSEPLFVKGERAGGTGKVSQQALDTANGYIGAGQEKVDKVVTFIEGRVPGYKIGRDAEGDVTAESLARGIMALEKHLANEAKAAAKGALAGV